MFLIHLLWHGWKSGLWEAEYRELIKVFSSKFVVTWLKFSFGKLNLWEVPIEMFLSIFVVTWLKFGFWKLNLWKFPSRRFWVICCDMVEIWCLGTSFYENQWTCFRGICFDNLKSGFWEAEFYRTDQDVVMLWANTFLWQCEFAGEGEGFQHMEANMALVNCSYFSSADDSHLCSCNSLHHLWFNILPCFCWHIKAWQQFAWLQSKACMNVAASISITLPRGTWTNYKTRFHPVTFLLQIS
jgi:hypothetical protein